MKRWKSEPCEVCGGPGILELRWCSVACSEKANKPRPCAKIECWEKGVTGWLCATHRMFHSVQAGIRILTEHPGADDAVLFLEVDAYMGSLLRRLHVWRANDQGKLTQIMFWTFPWVTPRYEAAEALRLQQDNFRELLERYKGGIREIEGKMRERGILK